MKHLDTIIRAATCIVLLCIAARMKTFTDTFDTFRRQNNLNFAGLIQGVGMVNSTMVYSVGGRKMTVGTYTVSEIEKPVIQYFISSVDEWNTNRFWRCYK